MIKAVLFDMDGVIINSQPIYFKSQREVFNKLGINVSFAEVNSYVGATNTFLWSGIKQKYNLDTPLSELVKLEKDIFINYLVSNKDIKPIDGVINLIEDLCRNDVKLVLASSAFRKVVEIVIDKFHLEKYFEASVSGDDVVNGKPNPEIFLKAAKRIGIHPSECVVIEDSRNGIKAAKAAGMQCIGYENLNSGKQDLSDADMTIKSFYEISFDTISML